MAVFKNSRILHHLDEEIQPGGWVLLQHLAYPSVLRLLEKNDGRQRDAASRQVADEVVDVVNSLEGHPKVIAIALEGLHSLRRRLAQHCSRFGGCGEQRSRL